MKILIIPSENYVTKESPLSGIFQYHQAHFLKSHGYQVDVISFGFRSSKRGIKFQNSKIEYENDKGIHVYRYYKNKFLPMKLYNMSLYLKNVIYMGEKVFERYVKDHGLPDVIYAHNTLYAGAFAEHIKMKYKIPYIITEHSSLFLSSGLSQKQKLLSLNVFQKADGLSSVSLSLREKIQMLFPELDNRFINLGNLIDPIFTIDNEFEGEAFKKDNFRFLNIANVNDNKDQLGIIESFYNAFSNIDGVELYLGGDGPNMPKVKEKIKTLGLESKVNVLGLLSRADVKAHMKACDAFVLNSQFETFGVVVIEAMVCGKPVICSNCGGPEEFIKEFNGILFNKNESGALSKAMKEMVNTYDKYVSTDIQAYVLDQFYGKNYLKRINSLLERTKNDSNN